MAAGGAENVEYHRRHRVYGGIGAVSGRRDRRAGREERGGDQQELDGAAAERAGRRAAAGTAAADDRREDPVRRPEQRHAGGQQRGDGSTGEHRQRLHGRRAEGKGIHPERDRPDAGADQRHKGERGHRPGKELWIPAVPPGPAAERSGAGGHEPGCPDGNGNCDERGGEPCGGGHQPGAGAAGAERTGRRGKHGAEHREGRQRGKDAGRGTGEVRRRMGHQLGGRGRPCKDHGQRLRKGHTGGKAGRRGAQRGGQWCAGAAVPHHCEHHFRRRGQRHAGVCGDLCGHGH